MDDSVGGGGSVWNVPATLDVVIIPVGEAEVKVLVGLVNGIVVVDTWFMEDVTNGICDCCVNVGFEAGNGWSETVGKSVWNCVWVWPGGANVIVDDNVPKGLLLVVGNEELGRICVWVRPGNGGGAKVIVVENVFCGLLVIGNKEPGNICDWVNPGTVGGGNVIVVENVPVENVRPGNNVTIFVAAVVVGNTIDAPDNVAPGAKVM